MNTAEFASRGVAVRLRGAAAAIVFLLLLVAALPAAATTYQVGPTRPYANLNAVAGLLNPGDLVLVDGNQTYPSVILSRPGSQAQPITIRGVRVNGNRPVLSGGTNTISRIEAKASSTAPFWNAATRPR